MSDGQSLTVLFQTMELLFPSDLFYRAGDLILWSILITFLYNTIYC